MASASMTSSEALNSLVLLLLTAALLEAFGSEEEEGEESNLADMLAMAGMFMALSEMGSGSESFFYSSSTSSSSSTVSSATAYDGTGAAVGGGEATHQIDTVA